MQENDSSRFDHLKLRHLKLLELIYETGSLRRAAEHLCVSQPAVTMMLKEIEKMFGVPLVARSHRGVVLTPAGTEVRERLRIALNEITAARHAAQQANHHRTLRIGALPASMVELVPAAIEILHARDALPRISLREGTVEDLLEALVEGMLDCVVARIGATLMPDARLGELHYENIGEEFLHIVCGRHNQLAKKGRLTLEKVRDAPWVLPHRDSLTRRTFDDAFIRSGLRPPEPMIESLSFYSNMNIVTRSQLFAVAPTTAVRMFEGLNLIRVLPMQLKHTPESIAFICRLSNRDLPMLQAFRQAVQEASSMPQRMS